jgi:hypothetical protein
VLVRKVTSGAKSNLFNLPIDDAAAADDDAAAAGDAE